MGGKDRKLRRALKLYEAADYYRALEALERLQASRPQLRPALRHYLAFCSRWALVSPRGPHQAPDPNDLYDAGRRVRRATYLLWLPTFYLLWPLVDLRSEDGPGLFQASLPQILSLALGACMAVALYFLHTAFPFHLSSDKRRCKHCGKYTTYVSPNEGWAYLESNKCEMCGRSYPMPSAEWDTEEGMRYMYDRGSVADPKFYLEFEAPHPGARRSQAAQKVLESRREDEDDGQE